MSQPQPAPKADLTIRSFTPDDLPAVRTLMEGVYGMSRDPRYDAMRFLDTPGGPSVGCVAMDGPICAGLSMIWPMIFSNGKSEVKAGQSIESMVHPDYRGYGLFVRLASRVYARCAELGIEVIIGVPTQMAFGQRMSKLSWAHVGDCGRYVRPLTSKGLVPLASVVDGGLALWPRASRTVAGLAHARPSDDDLDDLLLRARPEPGTWSVARSSAWYTYRYQPTDHHRYHWVSLHEAGRLKGVAVWGEPGLPRTVGQGSARVSRAILFDLVAEDAPARAAVLSAAVARAGEAGVHIFYTMACGPEHRAALRANGFIRIGTSPLTVRTLTAACHPANPFVFDTWRLIGGDFDAL